MLPCTCLGRTLEGCPGGRSQAWLQWVQSQVIFPQGAGNTALWLIHWGAAGIHSGAGKASGSVNPGAGRAGRAGGRQGPGRRRVRTLGRKELRARPLPKLRSERMRPPGRAVASRTRRCGKAGWRQSLCAALSPEMPPPTTSTRGPRPGAPVLPPLDSIAPSRAVAALSQQSSSPCPAQRLAGEAGRAEGGPRDVGRGPAGRGCGLRNLST